jgi:hypothetical protein
MANFNLRRLNFSSNTVNGIAPIDEDQFQDALKAISKVVVERGVDKKDMGKTKWKTVVDDLERIFLQAGNHGDDRREQLWFIIERTTLYLLSKRYLLSKGDKSYEVVLREMGVREYVLPSSTKMIRV